MTDRQIDGKQEQRTVIRLRDAIAFYDSLPEETKKRFREITDHFERHFGFGMFLRNAILWKNDIKMLAGELWVVQDEVEKGNCRLTYTQIARVADQYADRWGMLHTDDVSSSLMEVLKMRDEGTLEIGELN